MLNLIWIIILTIGLSGGIIIGYWLRKTIAIRQVKSIEAKAKKLINEAKEKQKEILLQGKEKALKIIEQAKQQEEEGRRQLSYLQRRLERRESLFDQKLLDLEDRQQKIYEKASQVEKIKQEIQKIREEEMARLEKISGFTKTQAKEILMELTEKEVKDEQAARIRKLEKESSEEWDKKAKNLLSIALERCATPHTAETTRTVISLPSDEMKGRIIGREGRNIKVIEQLTGTEIIVDDTPEIVIASSFSPLRRQVAKKALDKLILDGRIQPSRIEAVIEQAKKELASDIQKAGEEAAYEMGIPGLDPELIRIIGRLKYRTSYGQNVLQHSIEVAHLSRLLAGEMGVDEVLAKKAGFFHDIGKALDQETEGGHPKIGEEIAKKFHLSEEIATAALTHHQDHPPTLISIIVKVADAISGARTGARKETYEEYLHRLEELENIAREFEGVEKAYAIQAGREIRVFVRPEEIDDAESLKLARKIANKIEKELKYPGEIKVNVIREMRVAEYAR